MLSFRKGCVSMQIKVADLPGIGKKMSFITAEQSKIVLIIHHTGKRELYFFQDADEDEADFSIDLTANETRELGAQLLGATYQPVDADQMKVFKNQFVMEWVELKKNSPLVGQSIRSAQVRNKTGATIVGIIKGDDVIVSPDIDTALELGDILMAAGKSEQISSFEALCEGKEEV